MSLDSKANRYSTWGNVAESVLTHVGDTSPEQQEILLNALKNTDIIIDGTCELMVNDYLSDRARALGIPYVWASGTHGGWGGIVGRVVPDTNKGCLQCFHRHHGEGVVKSPPADPSGNIQPVGCFHPTFPGAAFDMDQPALMAARLATATLCRGEEDGYPDFDWDVAVLRAWDQETGRPIAPEWETYNLNPHQACDCIQK